MHFLIWFGCLMVDVMITVILKNCGVILGGVPTIILYSITIGMAPLICRKWDRRKSDSKEQAATIRRGIKSSNVYLGIIIWLLSIAFVLILVCLNSKWHTSGTDIWYFIAIFSCFVSGGLCALGSKICLCAAIYNTISSILLFTASAVICFNTGVDIQFKPTIGFLIIIIVIIMMLVAIAQLVRAIYRFFIVYRSSVMFKVRCYDKIQKLQEIKDKGIISEEAFETIKQQILSKIR